MANMKMHNTAFVDTTRLLGYFLISAESTPRRLNQSIPA
jgi:hypothetical protein